ncbi:hypothetical protein SteCoe_11346 [Stentor coeruleus]|uniref:Uncharacterized protein n=1 Tax=Stentor coeruleus TaxID=5963 RepID=A0A1R2CDC4_9CILI|nr:hypothetical protein SteCoe_11346 [Stentor coeruleus]
MSSQFPCKIPFYLIDSSINNPSKTNLSWLSTAYQTYALAPELNLIKLGLNTGTYNSTISRIQLSSKGTYLYLLTDNNKMIRILTYPELKTVSILGGLITIKHFQITYNEKFLVFSTSAVLSFWDFDNEKCYQLGYWIIKISCFYVANDSKTIAVGLINGDVLLMDLIEKNHKGKYKSHNSPVRCISFFNDNQSMITAGGDMENPLDCCIRIWDIIGKSLRTLLYGHIFAVYSIAVSKNEDFFVTLSQDCTIRLWELQPSYNNHDEIVTKIQIENGVETIIHENNNEKLPQIKNIKAQLEKVFSSKKQKIEENELLELYSKILTPSQYQISFHIFPGNPFSAYSLLSYSDIILSNNSQDLIFKNNAIGTITILLLPSFFPQKYSNCLSRSLSSNLCITKSHTIFFIQYGSELFEASTNCFSFVKRNIIDSQFQALKCSFIKPKYFLTYFKNLITEEYGFSVWNVENMKFLGLYICGYIPVKDIALCEKKDLIISVDESAKVTMWEIGKVVFFKQWVEENSLDKIAISSDGEYCVRYNYCGDIYVSEIERLNNLCIIPKLQLQRGYMILGAYDCYIIEKNSNYSLIMWNIDEYIKTKHLEKHFCGSLVKKIIVLCSEYYSFLVFRTIKQKNYIELPLAKI